MERTGRPRRLENVCAPRFVRRWVPSCGWKRAGSCEPIVDSMFGAPARRATELIVGRH